MEPFIPKPVLLNCWKHHLGFIIHQINTYQSGDLPGKLKADLLNIGNSTTDLYTGTISPAEAAKIAIRLLKKKKLYRQDIYENWILGSEDRYRTMEFPDRSVWILKFGDNHERYIHIHPGRYVPNTLRVKATILKSVIGAMVLSRITWVRPGQLKTINQARKTFIGLSPVKSLRPGSELDKLLRIFESLLPGQV